MNSAARSAAGSGAGKGRPGGNRTVIEGGSQWRLRNWRVRSKLIVVLLIPVMVALALAGLRGWYELNRKEVYDEAVSSMNTLGDVSDLMNELQKERSLVVTFVASGRNGDPAPLETQFGATDAAIAKLEPYTEANPTGGIANRLPAIYATRDAALETAYPDTAVYGAYTAVVDALIAEAPSFTETLVDTDLSQRARAQLAVLEAKEYVARQTAALLIAATRNEFPVGLLDQARAAEASFNAEIANFRANATIDDAQFYSDTVVGPEIDDREQAKLLAFSRAVQGVPLDTNVDNLAAAGTVVVNSMRTVETELLASLRGLAEDAATTATQTALRDALIVFAALLIALLVTFIVARSLLKPLRVLRRDALDVANRRLPATVERILADPDPVEASKHAVEPVPIFTKEETGELARSFDAVQQQAVLMATEQALLRDNINSIFVNLSRRSQALVERQLSLIDRLEQDEQDPDQLASLFELDHLATRMRRNSESLLVLSGTGLSRQMNRPVPASDVVGAAVSEVEHYARIEVLSAPDIAVQGRAVSDLVHVIAELLDNATFFSGPEMKVIVRLAMTRKKELAIQITDQGVGMSEAEIASANARLADPPDLDVAVTRRMGLYVVARLAKRHNITVRLRDNEDIEGGLIARINVPAELVQPIGATPRSGMTSGISGMTSMQAPSTTGSLSIAADTGPDLHRQAPTPSRNSGIAGAFTGSMPRLRPDGSPMNETQQDRTPSEVAGYPPFMLTPEDTGSGFANGAPTRSTGLEQNGRPGEQAPDNPENSASALFGNPLPDSATADTGYFGAVEQAGTDSGRSAAPEEVDHNVDAPTERLPIYEAVLSQWFESADTGSAPQGGRGDHAETNGTNGSNGNGTNGATPAEEPAAPAEPALWTSPGDEGWQAAQTLLQTTAAAAEAKTTAGLPKRVPKAQLMPGSAAPRHEKPTTDDTDNTPVAPPLPPRSADAVRGRMSSFQQGVRRGRHALVDAYPGDQPGSEQSRQDEEQE
jgi:signal transduction histidine kinase